MPKEITHWVIAEQTFLAMEASPLKDLISNNKALYYYGVISFDTGFYAGGCHKKELIIAAENLHYSNNKGTYAALAGVAEWINKSGDLRGWAFLCGCLSHIMADSTFHPLVYYLTGNPHDHDPIRKKSANIKHRELEAALDIFTRGQVSLENEASVSILLKQIESELIIDLLISLYHINLSPRRKDVNQSVKNHGLYYSFFGSRLLYQFFKLINVMTWGALDLEMSLFYPVPTDDNTKYFSSIFEYTDPFTGEQRCETITQIQERVVRKTIAVYEMFAHSMSSDAAIDYFSNEPGPILA